MRKSLLGILCACIVLASAGSIFAQGKIDTEKNITKFPKSTLIGPGTPGEVEFIPASDIPNTVSCSDYYTFGSVEADMASQSSSAISGMTMGFFGNIKNNNPYPIVAGTLYVKIMKNVGGEKNANGPDIVDQFTALDNIIIPANGSVPAKFSWKVPAFAETGDYQIVTYFLSDKKFNLLGLSFTDDVVGNSFRFTIKGEKTGVMFDKNSATINELPYYFAANPPHISPDKDATVSLAIKNTTNTPQSARVQWKLYKWDSMGPDNLIREFTTTTTLKPTSSNSLQFIIPEKEAPVYYLVGELTYQDTKSIVNIRFVRDGVDKVRLNFPSIMKYPITANEPITLFTCLHNSGQSAQVQNNKVILELKNETGKVIESYIYEGIVTGEMMAVKKDFIAKKTLDTFSVHAALYTDNKLVDESTMKYDCTLLDPVKCPAKTIEPPKITQSMTKNISTLVLSLLALIVLIILIVKTKNKKTTLLPLVLLLLIPLCILQPTVVEAQVKQKILTFNENDALLYKFDRWDLTGWSWALVGARTTQVRYSVEVRDFDTFASITDNACIAIGRKMRFIFKKHLYTDIAWTGTGRSEDSPFGRWKTAKPGPMKVYNNHAICPGSDFVNVAMSTLIPPTSWGVYIGLVVEPPPLRSVTFTAPAAGGAVMDCGPMRPGVPGPDSDPNNEGRDYYMDCEAKTAGTIDPTFTFAPTEGRMYYAYYDGRNGPEVNYEPAGCYSNKTDTPLHYAAGAIPGCWIGGYGPAGRNSAACFTTAGPEYVLHVPQTDISYNLQVISVALSHIPYDLRITGPTTGAPSTPYEFKIQAKDDVDAIKYGIDWDNDDIVDEWLPGDGTFVDPKVGPLFGEQSTTKSWAVPGTYTFKVRAYDTCGAHSDWKFHTIVISNLPDLIASPPTPNTAFLGVPQSYSSTITNQGATTTGTDFWNHFEFSALPNGTAYIGEQSFIWRPLPLNAGASFVITSDPWPFLGIGISSVRVCADQIMRGDLGIIPESREDNNCSDWTNVNVVAGTTPNTPSLTVTPSTCGNYWLDISWTASPGATSYTLYRGVTVIYSGPDLSFRDSGLIPGYSYSYMITASNAEGTSAISWQPVRGTVSSACDSCDNFDDIQTGIPNGFFRSGTNNCTCS